VRYRVHGQPEEILMLTIQSLKCIYDTSARGWAMELVFEGETVTKRFDVDGPDDAEMLIESFEDSSSSIFDPATGEISFAYEYAAHEDEETKTSELEDDDAEEHDEDGDDDGHHHDDNKQIQKKVA
jgi:DNA-directed RNA polymerase subunit delta